MMNEPCDNIKIVKSQKTIKFYETYGKLINDFTGDKVMTVFEW